METHLRLILLGVGLLILAGILFDGFRRNRRRRHQQTPTLGQTEDIDDDVLFDPVVSGAVDPTIGDVHVIDRSKKYTARVRTKKPQAAEPIEPTVDPAPQVKAKPVKKTNANDVIMLNVFADENRAFMGYELLQALLSTGLRFGQMSIFHRHVNRNGTGSILFSVAQATEPGSFEMTNMGSTACHGLTLFMQCSLVDDSEAVFELMLETAEELAQDLGGQLLDARRAELTEETIASYRDQARGLVEAIEH